MGGAGLGIAQTLMRSIQFRAADGTEADPSASAEQFAIGNGQTPSVQA